ncbi:phosphonate C-P lyase system protein PhnH [Dyella acidiphila]|uniref:Phosphonate C-P lyase system protein PhnH n=1 Tax=Dyella acidiphila TaxID=2775866 RepID=A0ABR9GDN4_9GAMM|nr:phosphonate C-P lyase system protein PhnH [Dyella acidiphila]MBE1162162.1 phosphonate C-P lyase system protein PhnH [Dyella acidiphila]
MMLAAFAQPVFDSQRTFRELLQAMARPALPRTLPIVPPAPAPIAPAAMAILLTLCDSATSVWLQQPDEEAMRHLRFHAGVKLAQRPEEADFALISDPGSMPALDVFARGDLRYPERSASLIIQVAAIQSPAAGKGGSQFAGPGIRDTATLHVEGLHADFWPQRAALAEQLPLGIDLYFVAAQQLACLPRTTRRLEG